MIDGKQQCRTLRASQGKYETIPDSDCRYAVHPDGPVVLSGWYRDGFAPRLHHLWDRDVDRSDELAGLDETVQQQRVLVWLPGRGVLVIDRLFGKGTHDVDRIFHLQPFDVSEAGDEPAFEPGTLHLTGHSACQLTRGDQPGVLLVCGNGAFCWRDHCGSRDPLRGWTSLYGTQPSHDVWRSGRIDLPAVMGMWIQPWTSRQGPAQAHLDIRQTGSSVEFSVQVDGSGVIHGTTDCSTLDLRVEGK